jgi:hypothetical protein
MKHEFVITILSATLGCRASVPSENNTTTSAEPSSAVPGGQARDLIPERSPTTLANSQTLTLVGCLQGPPILVGSSAEAATTVVENDETRSNERFRLVNASASTPETAGVGTQGAGASGGALVSGRASFTLDGLPAEARGGINKQVRITGRLEAGSAVSGPQQSSTAVSRSSSQVTGSADKREGDDRLVGSASNRTNERHLIVETVQVVGSSCT